MARFERTTFFPMVEFREWLFAHHIAPSTVTIYTSLVRRFFRSIQWDGKRPITAEEVASFDSMLPLNSMGPWRSGWRQLAAHAASKGITLPVSFSRERKGRSEAERLQRAKDRVEARQHPLGPVFHGLAREMSLSFLPHIVWAKVAPGMEYATIEVSVRGSKFELSVRQKWIDALREWGKPTAKTDPLVPMEPGSLLPMNGRKIRLIKEHYSNGFVDFTGKPVEAKPSEGSDTSGKV